MPRFLFFFFILSAVTANADLREIRIETEPPIRGALKAEPGARQPLVFLLGGFETGQAAIDLIPQPKGVALASLDYPFSLEGKWTAKTILNRGLELRRALRVVDESLCRFLDKARADPRVDPERIVVVGASFGAPYALAAADRCPGVTALILLQGFGDVPGTLASRMRKGVARGVGETLAGPISKFLGWFGWIALGLEAPEDTARRLNPSLPVLWIEAAEDDLIPEASKRSLVEAFGGHRDFHRQSVSGAHLRPGNTEQVLDLFERSLDWLKARGIL